LFNTYYSDIIVTLTHFGFGAAFNNGNTAKFIPCVIFTCISKY